MNEMKKKHNQCDHNDDDKVMIQIYNHLNLNNNDDDDEKNPFFWLL